MITGLYPFAVGFKAQQLLVEIQELWAALYIQSAEITLAAAGLVMVAVEDDAFELYPGWTNAAKVPHEGGFPGLPIGNTVWYQETGPEGHMRWISQGDLGTCEFAKLPGQGGELQQHRLWRQAYHDQVIHRLTPWLVSVSLNIPTENEFFVSASQAVQNLCPSS
jgi:hypothetical protein